ncbi:MAG: hypothetical protein FJ096_01625 [Deltaproteobacteria bacterium]|nr:hypothetical protein [Deltaproteobacteria bacterium]
MTTKRSPSRRSPFVTTVAMTGASWLGGCGGKVLVEEPPTTTTPRAPLECPATRPADDSPCPTFEPSIDGEELFCSYDGNQGCGVDLRCEPGGTWANVSPTCNPPPPLACPTDVPVAGVPCPPFGPLDGPSLECTYMTSSSCPEQYNCAPGGAWTNTSPTCNPPPPCSGYADETTCVAQGCAWNGMACIDQQP